MQELICSYASCAVILAELHPSVAVADPNAFDISLAAGLHPNGTAVNVLVNSGGV